MQIITGRIVKDAEIRTTKSNKQVVSFTLVENDYYKTKDGKREEIKTFFNCAYWNSTAIAPHLKKGRLVSLYGRVGINSYQKQDRDFIANLTFQTESIKFLGGGKDSEAPQQTANKESVPAGTPETKDDLPF